MDATLSDHGRSAEARIEAFLTRPEALCISGLRRPHRQPNKRKLHLQMRAKLDVGNQTRPKNLCSYSNNDIEPLVAFIAVHPSVAPTPWHHASFNAMTRTRMDGNCCLLEYANEVVINE